MESFSIDDVLNELRHYLPAQAPLKDFIHHNTLHAFQNEKFSKALTDANRIFGYKTYLTFEEYQKLYKQGRISKASLEKSLQLKNKEVNVTLDELLAAKDLMYTAPRIGTLRDEWKNKFKIDLDVRVHPLLFRLLASYLDQGVSVWNFPIENKDFYKTIRELDKNSYVHLFKSKRAKKLLHTPNLRVEKLLKILVGDEALFEHYIFDQQFAHPGWSGIVAVIESNPGSLLDKKSISLLDLIKIELLFEIDILDSQFGEIWAPLGSKIKKHPANLFAPIKKQKNDILKEIWQDAFERTYYDQVIYGLQVNKTLDLKVKNESFQAIFCIDDRECSIRRHIEALNPTCQTYGTAGHFNVEFYFQPMHGKFHTKVCPAPVTPKYLIQEHGVQKRKKKDFHFNKWSNSLVFGWVLTHTVGLLSGLKLALSIFRPHIEAATSSSSMHMSPNSTLTIENTSKSNFKDGLQIGFKIEEMTDRVEGLLKSIGLVNDFAPLIYAIGHGSTSVNNTHYAGYDCGACSGRPGSVNARVIAAMANHPSVRQELTKRGITIPETTQFVGALHDTSRDEFSYFDLHILSQANKEKHLQNCVSFEVALANNSKERSRRFLSINSKKGAASIHKKVKTRTVSIFEPRPELNHATNALAIVGRRSFTKGVFLDRRSFLNSYDYTIDPEGKYLLTILNAVAPVCGGINLEYYFSRVDNHNLGAGTKLPHNVMGLIGVANGTDGDLRTGLPKQMVEVHDPIRLLVIVEHFPDVVLNTIKQNPSTYNWFDKEWVKLVVCNPENKVFYEFKDGNFEPYFSTVSSLETISNMEQVVEMHEDNLPVYLLKNEVKWS